MDAVKFGRVAEAFARFHARFVPRRGEEMIRTLNHGRPQPVLEHMREEFPFLADAITGYALGDVWGRTILDDRTRQIAAVAAFASLGMPDLMKVHAGYALNVGASEEEIRRWSIFSRFSPVSGGRSKRRRR
jgi:alkylhydroperoxidase/carboxymuconolactone decarboxylase family protein YurZ